MICICIMSKIYSKDYRECVVDNIRNGMSRKEAIRIFKIGSDTITRWLRWSKQDRGLETISRNRYESKKLSDDELLLYIKANEDSTLEEIAEHFRMSTHAIWYRLKQLGITRKKKPRYTQKEMRKSVQNF